MSLHHYVTSVHMKKEFRLVGSCFLCFDMFIDSNKIRLLRRRKLWEEKKKLLQTIKLYNEQVLDEEERIIEEKVESGLSVGGGDSLIWPWEVHSSGK